LDSDGRDLGHLDPERSKVRAQIALGVAGTDCFRGSVARTAEVIQFDNRDALPRSIEIRREVVQRRDLWRSEGALVRGLCTAARTARAGVAPQVRCGRRPVVEAENRDHDIAEFVRYGNAASARP